MSAFFIFIAAGSYLTAAICLAIFGSQTAQNQASLSKNHRLKPFGILLGSIAFSAHVISLALLLSAAGNTSPETSEPFSINYFQAISLLGCGVVLVLLLTAMLRPAAVLGAIIFPFAMLAVITPYIFTEFSVTPPRPIATASWPHVLMGMLGFGFFTAAAAQALLLNLQNRRLKHPQPGRLVSVLPPLEAMESLLIGFVWAGFITLSAILLSGLLITGDLLGQHLAHKAILSFIAWLIYAALLIGRWRFGWRGNTAVRYTLGGYLVLVVAYFGSKLVLELLLGEYWG